MTFPNGLPALRRALALCVLMSLVPAQALGQSVADRFAPVLAALQTCQLFIMSADGYTRHLPARFLTEWWAPQTLDAIARHARTRADMGAELREAAQLQVAGGSSYQASTGYVALAQHMRAAGIPRVRRQDLIAAIGRAYDRALVKGGFHACITVKWGNRRPDIYAQPMRRATWEAIAALFERQKMARFALTTQERVHIASGLLTVAELHELRALRVGIALYERAFETLASDTGGWEGNIGRDALVCNDEATIVWEFVNKIEQAGLLTHFTVQDTIFVHRKPSAILPKDHFGALLRNLRTGGYFAIDSWAEDGGIPPHLATIEDWLAMRETHSVAGIGDAELDAALKAGRIGHGDKTGLLERLDAHLAQFEPPGVAPRPDGKPRFCSIGWCRKQPVGAW